jgi:hypothetical protein
LQQLNLCGSRDLQPALRFQLFTSTSRAAMAAAPKPACTDAAAALARCMEGTPCVEAGGMIVDCMKTAPSEAATLCERERLGYYLCRRQQLDMRTRIRGRKFLDSKGGEEGSP